MTDLQEALRRLNSGDHVGIPTETVYGLAARIDRPEGLKKIFATKARPFFDPLIVHVASVDQAKPLVTTWPLVADLLVQKFWPGPLTLVLPKSAVISDLITSGLESVALRSPNHPLALKLIQSSGPLAAPSANRFGRTSPTTASHVRQEFADQVFVIDGGPCDVGIESTVLALRGLKLNELSILRSGAITETMISRLLKDHRFDFEFQVPTDKRLAPGQMKHHYMPDIPLIVGPQGLSLESITEQANLRLQQLPDQVEGVTLRKPSGVLTRPLELRLNDDPALAARDLYAELRRLSATSADHLVFIQKDFHQGEAWNGLLDRLTKAASIILAK